MPLRGVARTKLLVVVSAFADWHCDLTLQGHSVWLQETVHTNLTPWRCGGVVVVPFPRAVAVKGSGPCRGSSCDSHSELMRKACAIIIAPLTAEVLHLAR